MTAPVALVDSNVLFAPPAEEHAHHASSLALLSGPLIARFAVAARGFAEAEVTLTRKGGPAAFDFSASEAIAALDRIRAKADLVALTPRQAFETIRGGAAQGGIGPRLCDALTGQVAVANRIPTIITWTTRHLAGLFPDRQVLAPAALLSAHGACR